MRQLSLVQSQLLKHYLSLLLVVSVMSEVGQNMYVSTSLVINIINASLNIVIYREISLTPLQAVGC